MRAFVVAGLAILVGCKGKAACKTDVDELMTFLRGIDHSPSLFWEDDIKLVERPDLPKKPPPLGPVVVIGKTIRFEGSEIALGEIGDKLTAARERAARYRSPRAVAAPTEVALAIDANARWGDVADVAREVAAAGFTHPAIAFGVPSTTKPPPREPVDDKLDEIKKLPEAGNKATKLAKLMTVIVKDCKALQKSFGRVSPVEGEDKAQVLIDEMGPALLECNCDVDIPALRNVFFAVANNPHPATVIQIELVKGGKEIALPAVTLWSEAQKQLADGAAVWLVAR